MIAGATLGKGVNRGIATLSGSALGLGCYYMVCLISRGDHTTVEPVLLGVITFLSSNIYINLICSIEFH